MGLFTLDDDSKVYTKLKLVCPESFLPLNLLLFGWFVGTIIVIVIYAVGNWLSK